MSCARARPEVEALVETEVAQTDREKLHIGPSCEKKRNLNFEGVLPPVGILVEAGIRKDLDQRSRELDVQRLLAEG